MKKKNKVLRMLVADDHNLVRQGIISLLEDSGKFCVVAEASSGQEMIDKYFDTKPDIVLADISMPRGKGTEAVKKITSKDPSAKVLFLTMLSDDEYIYYAKKSGGMGLVSKGVLKGELIHAILNVANGEEYFLNKTKEELDSIVAKFEVIKNKSSFKDIDPLTPREKEVLKYISDGLTSEEIAEKIYVSKKSIDLSRSNIMDKMDLKSLPQLIKFAIEFSNSESETL